MALSVGMEYNLEEMYSPINEFDSLVCCLQDTDTPHERFTDVARNTDYLFYPSIADAKCVVFYDRQVSELVLYGDDFVTMLDRFLPIERNLKGEIIADRIREDEWEEYPTDTLLARHLHRMTRGLSVSAWDGKEKRYYDYTVV